MENCYERKNPERYQGGRHGKGSNSPVHVFQKRDDRKHQPSQEHRSPEIPEQISQPPHDNGFTPISTPQGIDTPKNAQAKRTTLATVHLIEYIPCVRCRLMGIA